MTAALSVRHLLEQAHAGSPPPDAALLVEASSESPETPVGLARPMGQMSSPAVSLVRAFGIAKYSLVHAIEKTDRNGRRDQVTVGRADDNDIRLYSAQVAPVHAWFERTQGDSEMSWLLRDGGSSSGTRIDGNPVEREGSFPTTLSRVSFGPVCFVYVSRADVGQWVQTLLAAVCGTLRRRALDEVPCGPLVLEPFRFGPPPPAKPKPSPLELQGDADPGVFDAGRRARVPTDVFRRDARTGS